MSIQIQSGSLNLSLKGEDKHAMVEVTFPKSFGEAPTVVCSLNDTGPNSYTAYLNCMAFNVSAKGFQAYVKRIDGVAGSACQVLFNWIATD